MKGVHYIDEYLDVSGEHLDQLQRPSPSPDEVLMKKEEGDPESDIVKEAELRVIRKMFEHFFADGCNPLRVIRNVFSLGYMFFPGLFPNLKEWEIAVNLLMEPRNDWWRRKGKLVSRFWGKDRRELEAHEMQVRAMITDKRLGTCAARPWDKATKDI